MRTVNFRDGVLFPLARAAGFDPQGNFPETEAAALIDAINSRVRHAWEYYPWPELTITEERAFRTIWSATKRFRRQNATTGRPDELFYLPTFAYYAVQATAAADPPAGTLPTNTTYFAAVPSLAERYIALDQKCRRAIGEVLGVYGSNPRETGGGAPLFAAGGVPFRLGEKGIDVAQWLGGQTVWLQYRPRPSQFTFAQYDAARGYRAGELIYWPDDGEVYRAAANTTGYGPAAGLTYWSRVPMPALLAEYAKSGEVEWLRREVDKQLAQGDVHAYRMSGGAPRHVAWPLGTSGLWWSISAPWSSASAAAPTTLTEVCQDEGGTFIEEEDMIGIDAFSFHVALISGQEYIDLTFTGTDYADADAWDLVSPLQVQNTVDADPLNLEAGMITDRTASGCRIYLTAAPDTANYFLLGKTIGAVGA